MIKHDQSVKREEVIKLDKVNSLGRVCNTKITDEEMNLCLIIELIFINLDGLGRYSVQVRDEAFLFNEAVG